MSYARLCIPFAFGLLLSACSSNDPDPAQYGPDPVLPEPDRGLLPDMTVARPAPWGDPVPTVPDGYTISAIATDLKIPRQTLVLPNGDILVAGGRGRYAPPRTPKHVIAGYIISRRTTSVER